ncbi:hypothetical protein ASD24_09390 [Paenibacillus sp. Root52]|nr:GNAT family N-acetyltransferase [Paenibacillus amylolyticus]KQY84002.1 hypothetical protein ASD24_09390 [Paenibacillus sp. Root52]
MIGRIDGYAGMLDLGLIHVLCEQNRGVSLAMIRTFEQKDLQYVIEAHIRIYRNEYNYDHSFAIFIEESVREFSRTCRPKKEMIWIVDLDGVATGCIGLVELNEHTAQLRWFLIEPDARNEGWGRQLVEHAIQFAREQDYASILLWTNQDLTGARRLYQSFGFHVAETKRQFLSGQELTEEKWVLPLT